MIERRLGWVLAASILAVSSPVLAADPTPGATNEEVQQLQKQIEQLSKELADMKKLVENSQLPAEQRQMMMGHMGRMQGQMQAMMPMGPANCAEHMR